MNKKENNQPTEEKLKKVDDSLSNATIKHIETLKENNQTYFKELQDLSKQIEDKTKEILKLAFDEEEIDKMYKGNEIIYTIQVKDYKNKKDLIKNFEDTFKNIDNKFVADNFFLLLNNAIEQLQELSEEEKEKNFNSLVRAKSLMIDKEILLDSFDEIEDKIFENERELDSIYQGMIKDLPKLKQEAEIKKDKDFFKILETTSKAYINIIKLNEIDFNSKQYLKISIESKEDSSNHFIILKINTNFYKDINKSKVEKLTEENKRLEKEIQELKEEKQNTDKLDDFKPIPIDKAIAFNDKLSNNLHKLENNQEIEFLHTGGKKNKKFQQSVMKVLVKNGEMQTSKILEPFDRVILQSIYSLIQKNQFFDVQMLKEEMTGNKNRHKGTIDKEIETSLNKLRTTLIKIEIPEELQDTMETKFERVGIEDTILPIRKFFVVKGGHEKSVFGFTSNSIYFDYAKAKGQLVTKDTKLLQGGIGNATKETIILTDYITTRIEDMKHQKEKNRSNNYIEEIKFDTIFSLILTEKDSQMKQESLQKKKKRYIEQLKTILQTYKRDKYIKDFEEYSEGIKIKI